MFDVNKMPLVIGLPSLFKRRKELSKPATGVGSVFIPPVGVGLGVGLEVGLGVGLGVLFPFLAFANLCLVCVGCSSLVPGFPEEVRMAALSTIFLREA